jgi:hypothetical protein
MVATLAWPWGAALASFEGTAARSAALPRPPLKREGRPAQGVGRANPWDRDQERARLDDDSREADEFDEVGAPEWAALPACPTPFLPAFRTYRLPSAARLAGGAAPSSRLNPLRC